MDSNTKRPEWLTDEKIKEWKNLIKNCSNPYTKEEVENLPLDGELTGEVDLVRYMAYECKRILSEYGIR